MLQLADISTTYTILFYFSVPIITLDISSAINTKLIASMSFITDYNTLIQMNAGGIGIEQLIKAKTNFFYQLKLFSLSLLVFFVLAGLKMLGAPLILILITMLMVSLIVFFCPRSYFINNLILTRMDYCDYEKYFEEASILENGVDEYFPLSMAINVIFSLAFLATVISLLIPKIHMIVVFTYAGLVCSVFSLVIVLMRRIEKNIVVFVERGELSADFTKIFQKSDFSK
jgi:hypothetical protein